MIVLRIRPEFEETFTELSVNGAHEEAVVNILAAEFLRQDAEVEVLDDQGEWTDIRDVEHG